MYRLFLLLFSGCTLTAAAQRPVYESAHLIIHPLTATTYVHESFLQTGEFGKVSCNGLLCINNGEAVIIDTPTTDSASLELIRWVQAQGAVIRAVIPTHFHDDCLGGLDVFHEAGVSSYAHYLTKELAIANNSPVPVNSFQNEFSLQVGGTGVTARFFGEGHTRDNVVAYLPGENVLFGGCLIKSIGTGEGFTGDANLKAWSGTVEQIKSAYPNLKWVIPGHGAPGDVRLLDYTIELFRKE